MSEIYYTTLENEGHKTIENEQKLRILFSQMAVSSLIY